MSTLRPLVIALIAALTLASGCSSDATETSIDDQPADAVESSVAGIRLVTVAEGATIQTDPPEDLVILDVRTPEEFDESHLEGAIMVDFYEDDFANQLAELDPEVPYLLYCRSGNRSGQTTVIMKDLGFVDVADVNGGILAWTEAGNAVVNG